jgi:transposase
MKPKTSKSPESVVREIKRKTRRKFNSEEKIRIILEGLKGEDSIARRYLSSRRHSPESLLQMEQNVFTSRKAQAERGHDS